MWCVSCWLLVVGYSLFAYVVDYCLLFVVGVCALAVVCGGVFGVCGLHVLICCVLCFGVLCVELCVSCVMCCVCYGVCFVVYVVRVLCRVLMGVVRCALLVDCCVLIVVVLCVV